MIGVAERSQQPGNLKVEAEQAIRAELNAMLRAPIFAQSNRCKKFLSFIVTETLAGNSLHLKERTIGINVFERPIDYDTGDDSIVRVTANEVRKRIGQFYQESFEPHSVHIALPRGAYVPEFRLNPTISMREDPLLSSPHPAEIEVTQVSLEVAAGMLGTEGSKDVVLIAPEESTLHSAPRLSTSGDTNVHGAVRKRLILWALLILPLACLISLAVAWIRHQHRPPDVWAPFQNVPIPILVCFGAHDLPQASWTMSASDADRFPNLVLRRQVVPVDDVSVIANLGSLLGNQGVPFRVASADPTSLSDLRRQPVVLVGALDNKWSLYISQALPYHLVLFFPAGESGPWTGSIVDSRDRNQSWKVDFRTPISDWQHDYAIIARFDDPRTGVPVLLEGGLGNNGSIAASEFLTSRGLEASLAKEHTCSGKKAFEVVIETEMVGGKPGPPHPIRILCW